MKIPQVRLATTGTKARAKALAIAPPNTEPQGPVTPVLREWDSLPEVDLPSIPLGRQLTLPVGFHTLIGPKGTGKTITSLAIRLTAEAAGFEAAYVYAFEARAKLILNTGGDRSSGLDVLSTLFTNAAQFLTEGGGGDFLSYLSRIKWSRTSMVEARREPPRLFVFDSVTMPLKQCFPTARQSEGMGEKGFQVSDYAFCSHMNAIGILMNIVIIGSINTDMVQFGEKLEGATEGQLLLSSAGAGSGSNRGPSSGRAPIDFRIDEAIFEQARKELRYPDSASQPQTFARY